MYLIDHTTFVVLHVMAAWFPLSCLVAAIVALRARLVGGLWFWRIARVGGSVYIARRGAQ